MPKPPFTTSPPNLWSLQRERTKYTPTQLDTSGNPIQAAYELVQEWKGPSGGRASGTDYRDAWLAWIVGEMGPYASVEYNVQLPVESGAGVCLATITFTATEGLLERTWTLRGQDEQLGVFRHPNVVEQLQERWQPWPSVLKMYALAAKQKTKKLIDAWVEKGAVPPPPDIPNYAEKFPWPPSPYTPTVLEDNYAFRYTQLLMAEDNPVYLVSKYTLGKTEQVVVWSNIKINHLYVNRLMTYKRLLIEEPSLADTKLIELADLDELLWLKKSPEVVKTTGVRYDLRQDYTSSVLPKVDAGTAAKDNHALNQLVFIYDRILYDPEETDPNPPVYPDTIVTPPP